MPRPENRFDREHLRRLQQIQALIDRIYDEAVREAAAIGAGVADFDPSKAFEFADYPLTERRMAELTAWLRSQLSAAVVDGVEAAWTLSNNKNNELVYHVFGNRYDQLPEAARRRYLSTNETARDAFLRRKQQGLGLSERVCRYADEFRSEMEMGIDLGIRSGKPAAEMARDLQQYLQHPDMLFRRVRDEHGSLHLSKRAAAFHPGRGVYRSSYMNARRLAVTETNMAYRTADHERWRQMDFVVGIEIHLSNNHNCKGVPRGLFTDMCDALQGRYPKDFKFTGWHPHCRCYATTVLKTPEEMDADTERILDGEPVDGGSVNRVEDVPEGFRKWVEENRERIEGARSLPYFVRDNEGYVEVRQAAQAKQASESFKTRHLGMQGNLAHKETKAGEMRNDIPMKPLKPGAEVLEYTKKQAEQIGARMTGPMPYDKADKGFANLSGDDENCQSTVVAFFARLLGMDVTAKEYSFGGEFVKRLENDQTLAYYVSPTKKVHPTPSRKLMSAEEVMDYIDNETAKNGIYNIAFNKWKGREEGHIMCLIKNNGKAYFVDIQDGKRIGIADKLSHVDFVYENGLPQKGVELMRVDKCVLSDEALQVLAPL